MNAINIITPYKYEGMWVFDDARAGLSKEPFVSGADTMIDRVVADIPDADQGFVMLFSQTRSGCNGAGLIAAVTGTIARSLIWKAGCARHCFAILNRPLKIFLCRLKPKPPEIFHGLPGGQFIRTASLPLARLPAG